MEYYHQITCCLKGNLCIFWSCEGGEKKTLTGNFNAAPRRKPLHSNYSMQEANSPWNKCLMGNRGQSMRRLQASLASLRGERVSATPPAASANPPPPGLMSLLKRKWCQPVSLQQTDSAPSSFRASGFLQNRSHPKFTWIQPSLRPPLRHSFRVHVFSKWCSPECVFLDSQEPVQEDASE